MRLSFLPNFISFVGIFLLVNPIFSKAQEENGFFIETTGTLSFGSRIFLEKPAYPLQDSNHFSIALDPKIYIENDEGASFTFSPYLRFSTSDVSQNHFDIREGYYLNYGSLGNLDWELRLGIDQVFWGKAESSNPVNIINQIDFVHHPDGKTKLGQPLIQGSIIGDWGVLDLFILPIHRPQIFPSNKGRFRLSIPVLTSSDTIEYLSQQGRNHTDLAARYSHSIGIFDFGISIFRGTTRTPLLIPATFSGKNPLLPISQVNPPVPKSLKQYYGITEQFGFEGQFTFDTFLAKFEIVRKKDYVDPSQTMQPFRKSYNVSVAGIEYPIYTIFESNADVILFAEWSHDTLGKNSLNPLQNDLFLAARYVLNDFDDTDFSIGIIDDRDFNTKTMRLDFNRRLSENLSLNFEGFKFISEDPRDLATESISKDNYFGFTLDYNF